MKYNFALAALVTAVASASPEPSLLTRQTDNNEEYIREVCYPNTTSPIPPCQAIINIESACQPNGTLPLAYQAHQQCMCNGGYFPNWSGCLNCEYVHGARSEAVAEAYESIISSASSQFCGVATPTAVFASYFSAVSETSPQIATGVGVATTLSDRFPSQSAVSLYYTATGDQGPGAITGSAAQATAVVATSSAAVGSGSLAAGAVTTSRVSSSVVSSDMAKSSASSSSSSPSSSGSARSGGGSTTASRSSLSVASSSSASSTAAAQTGAANAVVVSEGLLAVVAGAMILM